MPHSAPFALLGALFIGCAASPQPNEPPPEPPPGDTLFRYDPERGVCLNARGEEGYNERTLEEILESQDGDCTQLSGRNLFRDLEGAGGGSFSGVSFRGANLKDTAFPPYGAPNGGPLHGADIRGAHDVYGMALVGEIDAHTRYHPEHCRVEEEDNVTRVLCKEPSDPSAP